MKALIVLSILLLTGCAHAPQPQTMLARAALSSVKVSDEAGSGSGVVVAPDTVLTCSHVVDEDVALIHARRGKVRWTVTAHVLLRDKEHDLLLLKTDSPLGLPAAPLAKVDPPQFSTLWSIAAPGGMPQVATQYILTDNDIPKPGSWLLSGYLWPGQSGGPVFNGFGEVVCLIQTTFLVQRGLMTGTCMSRPVLSSLVRTLVD